MQWGPVFFCWGGGGGGGEGVNILVDEPSFLKRVYLFCFVLFCILFVKMLIDL